MLYYFDNSEKLNVWICRCAVRCIMHLCTTADCDSANWKINWHVRINLLMVNERKRLPTMKTESESRENKTVWCDAIIFSLTLSPFIIVIAIAIANYSIVVAVVYSSEHARMHLTRYEWRNDTFLLCVVSAVVVRSYRRQFDEIVFDAWSYVVNCLSSWNQHPVLFILYFSLSLSLHFLFLFVFSLFFCDSSEHQPFLFVNLLFFSLFPEWICWHMNEWMNGKMLH